ncbi:LysR family transcriptional regulator [Sphingomonas sp. 22176]|uniref:LysR family transcriptional regulator n=1 Tax=Sphingomonas sp. 22176 TaxID=3453884 RepID=UPI003F87E26D
MHLDDLAAFAQVVRHGGFTAAAGAIGSQKAKLSRQVARLENDLQMRLLERSTRSLRLTEAGREIFEHCDVIADRVEATRLIAQRTRTEIVGLLRVCCPPGFARALEQDLLPGFLARHPGVRLELHVTSEDVDMVRDSFDVMRRGASDLPASGSLVVRQFSRLHRVLAATPTVAEAHAGKTPLDLPTLPTLTFGPPGRETHWGLFQPDGRRHELALLPRLASDDGTVIVEAARAGLGIALIPLVICREALAGGELVQLWPDWRIEEFGIALCYPSKKSMTPMLRAFIDHVVPGVDRQLAELMLDTGG